MKLSPLAEAQRILGVSQVKIYELANNPRVTWVVRLGEKNGRKQYKANIDRLEECIKNGNIIA